MVKLRLKIEFTCKNLTLPIAYQSAVQGMIYSIFDKEKYGKFLHDEGYHIDNKIFKMFVFSNLFGKYTMDNKTIVYSNKTCLYIASQSEEFIQIVYKFFVQNEFAVLNHQRIYVENIDFVGTPYFRGSQDIEIKTISPVVAYQTKDKYVTYFKPSDDEFEQLCLNNLLEKNNALENPIKDLDFSIKEIKNEKRRFLKYKNTFYIGYNAKMVVHTNYETLNLIYNSGLSAKGSAGFGMIEAIV